MLVQTETKAQGWRAIVVYKDHSEALIFVGRSSTQVRGNYAGAFNELLQDDEKENVSLIRLQQWQGAPDAGKWIDKAELRMPLPAKKKIAA